MKHVIFLNRNVSTDMAEHIVDMLVDYPTIMTAFKNRFFSQPDPKDIFILALTELRDTGDIDSLIRALNWQQNTINSLSCDLQGYHRSLSKLDTYRQEVARLKHRCNVLSQRNCELIQALRASCVKIPKSKKHENPTK